MILLPQYIFASSIDGFVTIIFVAIFLLLLAFVNEILFSLFLLYFAIISLVKVHIHLHWGNASDLTSRLNVFLQSPQNETQEYLQTYINLSDYILFFSAFILFILSIVLVHQLKQKHSIKNYFFILIIFAVLQNQRPLSLVSYYFISSQISEAISKRKELLLNEKNLKVNECNSIYDTLVIIQGESANKHHMGLYGYNINTTPFLNKLSKMNNFYKYEIIAPSNQTRYSVPMMFSDANVNEWYEKFSSSVSIITKLKRCGFKTHWISTQGRSGLHEDSITSIALEADDVQFLHNKVKKDEQILEYLKLINQNKDEKQAYIFHLMGSHFSYGGRYLQHKFYQHPSNIIEEYDNSIFSTDYLLGEIFKSLDKKKKVLFVYFSDHGEVVSVGKAGHGYFPSYKDEYEIPFVMYSNIFNDRLNFNQETKSKLNGESINKILEYVTGISDENTFSYSDEVFSLNPKNKIDYKNLNLFE